MSIVRPMKFCTKCQAVTPWNTHNRCMVCQRARSRGYAERRRQSGGGFSEAVKRKLIAENPDRCPKCGTPWSEVKQHAQHPNTPWHFDHDISPQMGGTSADENARIMCWPCNLRKLNKRA